MTSLSGNKDRSVSSRSRKHGVPELSPTKSAFFFPDTWYRKAYEETSRSNMRPNPEGAGSMPSSTGTPSPGSGISSPGSFSGSLGTVSPGIETGSPGSLGGSPGFGTGSPASGSGSSPCSDRGMLCENCNVRLTEMKRQALKLLLPGPYSSKDPSFSLHLHDKLQVPNSSRQAWNERDSCCDVCGTHLTQLKQEAVCMALPLEQWDLSPTSSPTTLFQRYVSQPPPGVQEVQGGPEPVDCATTTAPPSHPTLHSTQRASASPNKSPNPSPSHRPYHLSHRSPSGGQTSSGVPSNKQPQKAGHRLGSKPSFLGLGGGDRRNGSPGSGKAADSQQQPVSGPHTSSSTSGHSSTSGTAEALQTIQLNRTEGGVSLDPNQICLSTSEVSREGQTDTASTRPTTNSPARSTSPSHGGQAATTTTHTATSAAASFFARAAQKLSLASKKKKQKAALATAPVASTPSSSNPPLFATNFSSALVLTPPPAPPCLLRAANKIKDTPGLGKVKVMVRVCPVSQLEAAESSSFLKVDPRKKQIMIMDPSANQTQASQKRAGANQVSPKMFTFDAAFPPDASQVEVCAGTVAEVIQSVVNGADGCVFCFGHSKLGKSYTMIGRDDSLQTLGVIPCAISWLFKLINERREKTGARFSVRVSAVEVWGRDENLKDLLSEVATGNIQEGQSPGVYLFEDPICGMQLQNQSELRAPTPEKAGWYLDAAIAARHNSRHPDTTEEEHRNSHMLFTLHLYQYRMDKTGKGGMSGGRSRLHLLDLGSCDAKALPGGGRSRENSSHSAPLCLSLSALGNVILALVNGSKHIPYKESKLTMLLRESLGNMNCRTTMIAHISASPKDFSETLSTVQIASRVLRMKKKKSKVTVQYTSSSSGGESSCEEGHMRRPTQLRPFHHCGGADSDLLLLLPSDPDEYSSSEHSCDTVIYVGSNGGAVSDRELTDNEGPPEFVPIIPTLPQKVSEQQEQQDQQEQQEQQEQRLEQVQCQQEAPPELSAPPHQAQLAPVQEEGAECLKCNTFAELQERLDCIDGSEEVVTFPFEEVPADRRTRRQEPCLSYSLSTLTSVVPAAAAMMDIDTKTVSKGKTNDPQLQEIKEVLEEAVLAQTMLHSLAQMSGSSMVTCSSVTGHSGSSSVFYGVTDHSSCETNTDAKTRLMGSPRLGIASLSKTTDYRPPSSPSQRCKVFTQKSVLQTTTATQQPLPDDAVTSDSGVAADSGRSSTESLLSRISPLSAHPPGHDPTPSLSVSLGSAETLCVHDVSTCGSPNSSSVSGVSTGLENTGDPIRRSLKEEVVLKEDSPRRTPLAMVHAGPPNTEKLILIQKQILFPSTSATAPGEPSFENPWLKRGTLEGSGEKRDSHREGGSTGSSPDVLKRVVDGCEMVAMVSQGESLNLYNLDVHRTASLPRGWHCLNLHDGLDKRSEYCQLSSTSSTPSSPRATLDRRGSTLRQGFFSYKKNGLPPAPPVRKSSLEQQSRAASPPHHGDEGVTSGCVQTNAGRRGFNVDSGRLFSARLEQLANRTHSLGRVQRSNNSSYHYDCLSLERGESLRGGGGVRGDSTMPRAGHNLSRAGSLSSSGANTHHQAFRAGSGSSSAPQSPAHSSSQSRLSAVSKLLLSSSPKGRSLSTSSSKAPSLSNKSLSQTAGRSSSGKLQSSAHSLQQQQQQQQQGPASGSWSTQSLSRLRGGSLAAKLPLRAVNGRISELLQGSAGSRSRSHAQGGGADAGDEKVIGTLSGDAAAAAGSISSEDRAAAVVQTLPPSPYSKITAPRKPHRCSSGHASDNSSVLSGELPPAMGKTALFYHSGGSSGYESMVRDSSENTGSTSSTQDSLSEDSTATTSSRRSSKNSKKSRSSTGLQRRRLIPALTLDTSSSSSSSSSPSHRSAKQAITSSSSSSSSSQGACWVDGPLGLQPPPTSLRVTADTTENFEIKVYKIDDVERLQRRRDRRVSKEVVHQPSARLRLLEHRQQRISDLRAKYQCLKKELELTKQHLMLEEQTWTIQLQQVHEVDSLEYLEALETLTYKLETRVNFCKAHLMMVTCFDVSSKHW